MNRRQRRFLWILVVLLPASIISVFISVRAFQRPAKSQKPDNPSAIKPAKPEKFAPRPGISLATKEELAKEVCDVPTDNAQREEAFVKLLKQAGASEQDIKRQEVQVNGKTAHNILLIKPGRTDQVIVVGGHIDHVSEGAGVIDDWSGACAVTNVYQAISKLSLECTIIFVGFTGEEEGLRGSGAYVKQLSPTDKAKHRAMINLECLGLGDSRVWINGSEKDLMAQLQSFAASQHFTLLAEELTGVGADSQPFNDGNIPALTLYGLPKDKFSYIHSEDDQCQHMNQDYYYDSYRLAVSFLLEVDNNIKIANEKTK